MREPPGSPAHAATRGGSIAVILAAFWPQANDAVFKSDPKK